MGYSTTWEQEYDERTLEVTKAATDNALLIEPRVWPISGVTGTAFPLEDTWFKFKPEGGA